MNVMLPSGGYPFKVVPFVTRNKFMPTLEKASVRRNI